MINRPIPLKQDFEQETLSFAFVSVVLFVIVAIFAGFSILTPLAMEIGITFSTFALLGVGITVVVGILSTVYAIKQFKYQNLKKDYHALLILLFITISSGIIASHARQIDEDDFYYVGNIVHYLSTPSDSVDHSIHYFVEDEDPLKAYGQSVAIAFEYIQGTIAFVLQVDFLTVYYHATIIFLGLMFSLSIYFMLSTFSDNPYACLFGTVVIISVLLILTEKQRTFGGFGYLRFKHGKAVAMAIGIPLIVAFSIRYFKQRTWFSWIALFLLFTAMTGLTPSSLPIAGALSVGLLLGHIASLNLFKQFRTVIHLGFTYGLSQSFLIGSGIFLLFNHEFELGLDSPINAGRYPTSFVGHLRLLMNFSSSSPTFVLLCLSIVIFIIFVGGKWQKRFIIAWMATVVVFFLNPVSADLLIKYVTSQNTYWRMFYIFPFPLITGLIAVQFYLTLPKDFRGFIANSLAILILGSSLYIFQSQGFWGWQEYRYREVSLRNAEIVLNAAPPPGPMLSPPIIGNTISLFTADYPQYSIKGESTKLFLRSRDEAVLRDDAAQFLLVGGDPSILEEFLENEEPTSIVISIHALLTEPTRDILSSYGYTKFERADDDSIFIYWKPDSST